MTNRREALKIIGAVGVTCAFPFSANELYGQHLHDSGHAAAQRDKPDEPFVPRFFTAAQLPVVARLTDLIIPPTDTPGAAAAGVPEYIDLVVSADSELQRIFREGLPELEKGSASRFGGKGLLSLNEAQQVALLTSMSEATGGERSFFEAIKNLTADGYYTSRVGLLQELGYNGNDYRAAFPEFKLPEQ